MGKKILIGLGVFVLLLAVGAWALSSADIPHEELRKRYGQAPSKFITLSDGTRAHYRDQGPRTAPLIVLLHGSNSSLHTWAGWVKAMKPTYRVLTVDLPGHGLTGKVPGGKYGYPAMVAFLHAFLKQVKITKTFVLGGNSMGGALAWKYTVAHPAQVKKLMLLDAAGVPRKGKANIPIGFRIARNPILRHIVHYITPRRLVEKGIKKCYADPGKVTDALITRYRDLMLHPGNRLAMTLRFAGYKPLKQVPDLSGIKVPTLIMWGAKDTLTPPGMAKLFAKHIKHNKVIMYKDLGHIPMEEAPIRTAKDAMAFIASAHVKAAPQKPTSKE